MTDYQRYKELIKEIGDKKIQITALQNRIANIDSEPELNTEEVKELQRIYHRFMDDYPFFTYRQGASGTLETKTLLFYKGLSDNGVYTNKRIVIGKATNGSTYPTGRTTIARTYQNASGTSITTTPNLNPSGNISASTSFCGHFKGSANLATLRNSMMGISIGVLVTEQENTLDSTEAMRAAHYPRSLFEDLESVSYSPQDILDIQERIREEVRIRFNSEIATLTEQITALTEERVEIEQNLETLLVQSQTQLQEKQEALNNLEQTLENLEQNNASTLTEIATMQEEIARLEAELANLNNANPEYAENLQELENLRNQKTTLESQIADFTNNIAAKEAELESVRSEVSTKEQELQDLQNQSTQLESELNALNIQKQELQPQIQNTQDSIAENSAKKPVLESEITQLQEDLNNQNTLSAELQAQITELEQQKAQLESQLATLADPELLARRDQLNADITNLQTQIQNAQNNIQGLEAEIATLQTQKTELESTLQEANTRLTELQMQKQELQTQIAPKAQELESLQFQITQAQNELDALRAQNAELESNLAQKRTELQTLKDAIANYDVNALNSELQVLLMQIPQKQQELADLEALIVQNQGQRDILTQLETQIAEKQAELDSYADSEIYKAQQTLEALKKKLEAILNTNSFVLESDLKDLHMRAINLAKTLKIEICQSQSSVEYIPQSDKPKNFVGFMYRAKDGERLDSIVYAHYGTLDLFQSVLACNPNLLNHRILRAGEIVWLPSADTKAKSLENRLWS